MQSATMIARTIFHSVLVLILLGVTNPTGILVLLLKDVHAVLWIDAVDQDEDMIITTRHDGEPEVSYQEESRRDGHRGIKSILKNRLTILLLPTGPTLSNQERDVTWGSHVPCILPVVPFPVFHPPPTVA